MPSITAHLADYIYSYRQRSLPPEVMAEAKFCLLDTLACALGGCDAPASHITRRVVHSLGGNRESTLIGVAEKASCLGATLANGVAVRYLDYNDTLANPMPEGEQPLMPVHPSETIPAVLALGEVVGAHGDQVLRAIVLAYEMNARLIDTVQRISFKERGFHHASLGALSVAAAAGYLLDLTPPQIQQALGVAGTVVTLNILDGLPTEPNTMAKNSAYPIAAQHGLLSAMLAKEGFTGPERIIEGYKGFGHVVMHDEFLPELLTRTDGDYGILKTLRKAYAADHTTHGVISAAVAIATANHFEPTTIEKIEVRAGKRCITHTGDLELNYAVNKETADHSLPYLVAVSLLEGDAGPRQFRPALMRASHVRQMAECVTLQADKRFDALVAGGGVVVHLKDGRQLEQVVEHQRGHYLNPMTRAEVETKFTGSAQQWLSDDACRQVIAQVEKLDQATSLDELTSLLRFTAG